MIKGDQINDENVMGNDENIRGDMIYLGKLKNISLTMISLMNYDSSKGEQ